MRPLKPLLLLLILLLLAGCSYEAALVLSDIAAGEKPSRLKEITSAPTRQPITFSRDSRSYQGDLYMPGEPVEAGLLLVPGAAEGGKDDPRLIAFARSMARARFAVLVPDFTSLRQLKVNSGNILEVGDAFAYLASRPDLAPAGRAGILAFSYAAGPAILTALDEQLDPRVRFVFAIGGYHDLDRVLTFFTTGHVQKDGKKLELEPNAYGKWVFVLSNLDRLGDPNDRAVLEEMAERKKANLAAALDDLTARLGPEGRRVYDFISNKHPDRVDDLQKKLPEEIRKDIELLNLANKDLSHLASRLILVHGYDDSIIPYTESIALARAVPERMSRLYLVRGLFHVDLKPGLISSFRLWRAICDLLAERTD